MHTYTGTLLLGMTLQSFLLVDHDYIMIPEVNKSKPSEGDVKFMRDQEHIIMTKQEQKLKIGNPIRTLK